MRLLKFFAIMLPVFGIPVQAEQSGTASLITGAESYVRQQVATENSENLSVVAQQLDPRIGVPQCPEGFGFNASSEALQQSNVTLKATCPSQNWYLYLTVNVQKTQTVVVASAPLSPGTVLAESNVEITQLDQQRLRSSTFSSTQDLLGARVKRRLRPGQPITPSLLCFVCKGDSIVILAKIGELSVKTRGIAQQDGNLGDTIRVLNRRSKKIVDAVVSNSGQVLVNI